MFTSSRQSGVSLVELIMFIVIVSIALANVIGVLNLNTSHSADPMVNKQAIAIAESLLEEIEQKPFTFCDPDDANASTAQNSIVGDPLGCATLSEDTAIGPEAGETTRPQFDNVSDYNGFVMNPMTDISGTGILTLAGYSASVVVTQAALCAGAICAAATESLRISVTVNGPGGYSITMDGYRTRYAPNTTP
jgi:MSHA pilin protein MshD